MPGVAAPCSTPEFAGLATSEGAGVAVEVIVCGGVGEPDAAGLGAAFGVVRGAGVTLGTNKRPRRCDAVGKGDTDDTGGELAAGVGDCPGVALRGVVVGSGVDLGVTDGASVGDRSGELALLGVVLDSGVDVAAIEGACVADIVAAGDGVVATVVDVGGVPEA